MLNFLLALCFVTTNAHALDAIVIVLEAPLLKEPDIHSVVLQTIRKGQRVFVPRKVVTNRALPEFIPTFDRVGNRAYIPSRFIKIISQNASEYNQPITLQQDPTDYRLEEPIPVTYPFNNNDFVRASVAFIVGNNTQTTYNFEPSYIQNDLKNEVGLRLFVARKVSFDNYDRFYFGFLGSITNTENTIDFANANKATESRALYRGGPALIYDVFKSEKMRFSFGGGFTYNYHKSLVTILSNAGESEDRVFSGFSLSPLITSTFQIASVVPNTDLIGGADISFILPHVQKAQSEAAFPALWSAADEIKTTFKLQAALFFGVQVKY